MDSSAIITIIGGIASICGAAVAIKQAINAKKSAETASEIKQHFIQQREITELSKLQFATQRIQKIMAKYGASATQTSLIGVNRQVDANDLQEYLILLKDNRNSFGLENPNEIDILCTKVTKLLEYLVRASNFDDIQKNGRQILIHLMDISPIIKSQLEKCSDTLRVNNCI